MKWPWHRSQRNMASRTDEIFNSGLDIALDFDNWLCPIEAKLGQRHPELSAAVLAQTSDACKEAVSYGLALAMQLSSGAIRPDIEREFIDQFRARYPQTSPANCERAFRHCVYYATKTTRVRQTPTGNSGS